MGPRSRGGEGRPQLPRPQPPSARILTRRPPLLLYFLLVCVRARARLSRGGVGCGGGTVG